MTNLLTLMQRSLFKLGGGIAGLFLPPAVDEGAVRPSDIRGFAASAAAIRWTNQGCFRTHTARHPVNDNRHWNSGIDLILAEDEIRSSALWFDRFERASNGCNRPLALRPKQASFPALDEVVSDDIAALTQEGA
jgi:hypothetical protein